MIIAPTSNPALACLNSFCDNPRQTSDGDLIYTQPIHAWTSQNGPGSDHDARLRLKEFRGGELVTTVEQLFDAVPEHAELESSGQRRYDWQKIDDNGTLRSVGIWLTPTGATSRYAVRLVQQTNQVRYEMLTAEDGIYLGGLMFIADPAHLCHFYKNPYVRGGFVALLKSLTNLAAETCGVDENAILVEQGANANLAVLKIPGGRFLCAEKLKTTEGEVYRIDIAPLKNFYRYAALTLTGTSGNFADHSRLRRIESGKIILRHAQGDLA